MISKKRLAACRRNIRIAHALPATEKQRAAARKNGRRNWFKPGYKATKAQRAASSKNIKLAFGLPRTEKQKLAVFQNLKFATAASKSLPRSEKQLLSSKKTIMFAHKGLKRVRKTKKEICEICGKLSFPYRDHCHKTGKQRGILCVNCNLGIGIFKDNTDFLKSAIEYLEKHRTRFPRRARFPRLVA